MFRLAVLFLFFPLIWSCSIGYAADADAFDHSLPLDAGMDQDSHQAGDREGGETWYNAILIDSLPYSDTGNTCDNHDDITLPCAASAAADVVYRFVPETTAQYTISLCGSGYDTALAIYNVAHEIILCNDGACYLQSEFFSVELRANNTYYIVVDGNHSNCGPYQIEVRTPPANCELECPPGAQPEGEPPCHENYVDEYNGGCWWDMRFQPICPQEGNSAVICGKTGTFLLNGWTYRDTDWYQVWGAGPYTNITVSVQAEFPVLAYVVCWLDCWLDPCGMLELEPCEPGETPIHLGSEGSAWVIIMPLRQNAVPCELDYVLTVGNIAPGPDCGPSPVKKMSWGAIKSLYR